MTAQTVTVTARCASDPECPWVAVIVGDLDDATCAAAAHGLHRHAGMTDDGREALFVGDIAATDVLELARYVGRPS